VPSHHFYDIFFIKMNNFKQLALNLCLKDAATFVNFFVGANEQLVKTLGGLNTNNETRFVYVWGKTWRR